MPFGLGGDTAYVSPYWNPQAFDFPTAGNSQWQNAMLEKSPETAYYRYMRQLGAPIEQETPFGKYLQNQYGNYLTGYNAYTVSHPLDATISRYTSTLPDYSHWERAFNALAPQQRGVSYSNAGAGPARWIG
jgi:hypothetical protein